MFSNKDTDSYSSKRNIRPFDFIRQKIDYRCLAQNNNYKETYSFLYQNRGLIMLDYSSSNTTNTASNLPLARCASLRGYHALVTRFGGNPKALLEAVGLGRVPIEEENLMIPTHALYNALELASQELNLPDFGLRLSQYQEFDILGLLALMIKNTDSVLQLLQLLNKHYHSMHNHGARISYSIAGTELCLQYEHAVPQAVGLEQSTFLALGFVAQMAQTILLPNIKPRAVYFKCDAPKDIALFKEIFQAPVYFNQVFNGATIDTAALQQPYKIANVIIPGVEALCLDTLNNAVETVTLSQQLSLLISEQISYGKIDLKYYAAQLHLSDRTLQRKLKLENTSFKEVLDGIRKDLALRYIQQNSLNMAQITEALCFSDQAVFSRAFRRWYKVTAIAYKKSIFHNKADA